MDPLLEAQIALAEIDREQLIAQKATDLANIDRQIEQFPPKKVILAADYDAQIAAADQRIADLQAKADATSQA